MSVASQARTAARHAATAQRKAARQSAAALRKEQRYKATLLKKEGVRNLAPKKSTSRTILEAPRKNRVI
jgi:hypothetical protein